MEGSKLAATTVTSSLPQGSHLESLIPTPTRLGTPKGKPLERSGERTATLTLAHPGTFPGRAPLTSIAPGRNDYVILHIMHKTFQVYG